MTWNRYAALGDSITEGYGMDPVEGIEPLPWAERVARELGVELHNLGRRNLRAAEIRERQLAAGLALEPDLVSIVAGPNDLLFDDFSAAAIACELEPMYAAFAETGADVFTFTFMNLPGSGLLPAPVAEVMRERMEALHVVIRRLAAEYGARIVDLYGDPRSASPDFFSADRLHANARGQRFVAEKTLSVLTKELQHA